MNFLITGNMKNFHFISLILCSFLFQSCFTDDSRIEREYGIMNNSNTTIKINFLQPNLIDILDSFVLQDGQTSEFRRTELRESVLNNPENPLSVWSSQNAVIRFNNEREVILNVTSSENGDIIFSEPISRNLFRNGNYEDIGNDQFVFTITQEDFENAIPCDGPCE